MGSLENTTDKIKQVLQSIYHERLVKVILYGSCAQGLNTADSDIDIAVILKGTVNKTQEIDRIYDVLYDLILESGELISVYPVSDEEVQNSTWPLHASIRDEGIVI
jgi:uncharacterized protein